VRYSPDEIKALALHYGSYEKASKKLGIGKASLVDAGNADIKGKAYRLSEKNYSKIHRHISRLGDKSKQDLKKWEKVLDSISDHPNVKRAFMNTKQSDREWVKELQNKAQYRKLKANIFWTKVMSKFYDKYGWKKGAWKR
jgi:hypothetical protein